MLQTHPPEEQVKGVAGEEAEEGEEVGVAEEEQQLKLLPTLHGVSWIVS